MVLQRTTRGCDTPVYPRVKITRAWNVRWIRAGARVGFTCVACDSAPWHPRSFVHILSSRSSAFLERRKLLRLSYALSRVTQAVSQPYGIYLVQPRDYEIEFTIRTSKIEFRNRIASPLFLRCSYVHILIHYFLTYITFRSSSLLSSYIATRFIESYFL